MASDAPKRIWLSPQDDLGYREWDEARDIVDYGEGFDPPTEYIRADIAYMQTVEATNDEAQTAAGEFDTLKRAALTWQDAATTEITRLRTELAEARAIIARAVDWHRDMHAKLDAAIEKVEMPDA